MHLSRRLTQHIKYSNILFNPTYYGITHRSMVFNHSLQIIIQYFASSYESLVSQLSTAQNYRNLLQVYQTNKDIFKSEHIILSLRMLGRFSKNISGDGSHQDEHLKELTSKLNEIAADLNEFDVVDILFWLRRFKQLRLPANLKPETYAVLFEKVNQYVTQKTFSFRNLINIFFDLQLLNKHSDLVVQEVIAQLKNDPKQLTPFSVVQILQACSQKDKQLLGREWLLIDLVIKNLEPMLDDLDVDQKSSIFKYLAQLELNLNYPAFRTPPIMYTLRSQLISKLEQLNETSVLNIIQSYQFLPYNFPGDLLEEIKEMVIVTLQHNPSNLKDQFLLDFVNNVTQIPRKRLDEAKLQIIQSEVAKRIESNEYLQKASQIDKIARVFQRLPKNQELLDVIASKLSMQGNQVPFIALEYLKLHNIYIQETIDLIIQNEDLQKRIGPLNLYRLIQFLDEANPQHQLHIQNYRSHLDTLIAEDPEKVINQLQQTSLNPQSQREYLQKAAKSLYEVLQKDPKKADQQMRSIYYSIGNKESRQQWLQFLEQDNFKTKQFVSRFIDQFNLDEHRFDQVQFFLQFLSNNQELINVNKLISTIKYNYSLCVEITRNEILVKQLFNLLSQTMAKQNYRLNLIVSLMTRFENCGFRSQIVRNFLQKIFESYKTQKGLETISDVAFLNLLMKYNALTPLDAFKEFNALRSDHPDITVKTRLFSQAYIYNKLDDSQKSTLNEQGQILLNSHLEKLQSDLLAKKLQSLPSLISLPPNLLQGHEKKIETILKQNSAQLNERAYLQCVLAIQPKFAQESKEIYQGIIRELSNQYPNHNKRLHFSQLLQVMEKFVRLQTKYIQLYNNFLGDISNSFNQLAPEYRIRSLSVFADSHIQQVDLFKKSLEKINENPYNYRPYVNDISQAVFQLGLNDQSVCDLYLKFINKFDSISYLNKQFLIFFKSSFEVLQILSVLSIFPITNLEAEASRVANLIKPDATFTDRLQFIVSLAELYKRKLPQAAIGQGLEKLLTQEDYKENFDRALGEKRRYMEFGLDFVGQYLRAMQVEFNPRFQINGLFADIVIPQQKLILLLVSQGQTNFDRSTLTGNFQLKNNIFATIEGYKVVQVPFFLFKNSGMHLNRVDFLVSLEFARNIIKQYQWKL